MSECTTPLFGEGTFFIMQHRGTDRIMFEVNAGKMISINVEPVDTAAPGAKALDDSADLRPAFIHPRGNC